MDLTYLLDRALAAHSAAEDAVHALFGYTDGDGAAIRDRREHCWWSDYEHFASSSVLAGTVVYAESAEAVRARVVRPDQPAARRTHVHKICVPAARGNPAWLSEDGQHIMLRLLGADGSRYLGVFRVSARVT